MTPTLAPPPPRSRRPRRRVSQAEYLAFERSPERANEARAELLADGTIREMSGARLPHQRLVQDLVQSIRAFLDEERFEVVSESVKFRPPRCRFYYPDAMVLPNPPELLDEAGDVVRNPVFVAEVLSTSTEALDRGEKRRCYLNTPSVLEYWLIDQDAARVERFHRPDRAAGWDAAAEVYEDRAAAVPLPALGGGVTVGDLYRRALPAG